MQQQCVLAQGTVRRNRRITGWVVLCPKHPDIARAVFKNKSKASLARAEHLEEQHPRRDVIAG